jgi:hypothetical protein
MSLARRADADSTEGTARRRNAARGILLDTPSLGNGRILE